MFWSQFFRCWKMQLTYQGCGLQVQRDYKPILDHKQCVLCECGMDESSQGSFVAAPSSPTPSSMSRLSDNIAVSPATRELFPPSSIGPFIGGIPCTLWKGIPFWCLFGFLNWFLGSTYYYIALRADAKLTGTSSSLTVRVPRIPLEGLALMVVVHDTLGLACVDPILTLKLEHRVDLTLAQSVLYLWRYPEQI
jgi:hypothetical protein